MNKLPKFGSFNVAEFFYDLSFEDYSCERHPIALQSEIDNGRIVHENGRNAMGLVFQPAIDSTVTSKQYLQYALGTRVLVIGSDDDDGIYTWRNGDWVEVPVPVGATVFNANNSDTYIKISDGWSQLLII